HFLAALAAQLLGVRLERLPVPAAGAHSVRQGEDATDPLDLAGLAPHDTPALRGMIADFEEAAVDGYVTPVHIEHDDVARGDAHHGVPRTAAQQVRPRLPDSGPPLRLEARWGDRAERNRHTRKLHGPVTGGRDRSHTQRARGMCRVTASRGEESCGAVARVAQG